MFILFLSQNIEIFEIILTVSLFLPNRKIKGYPQSSEYPFFILKISCLVRLTPNLACIV